MSTSTSNSNSNEQLETYIINILDNIINSKEEYKDEVLIHTHLIDEIYYEDYETIYILELLNDSLTKEYIEGLSRIQIKNLYRFLLDLTEIFYEPNHSFFKKIIWEETRRKCFDLYVKIFLYCNVLLKHYDRENDCVSYFIPIHDKLVKYWRNHYKSRGPKFKEFKDYIEHLKNRRV